MPYGMSFLFILNCLGLCQDKYLTCSLVSVLVVAVRVLLCERWCLLAFCGVIGRKEVIEVLRTARER